MKPACGHTKENFQLLSPTLKIEKMRNQRDVLLQLPPFWLLHGEDDTTVPHVSTDEFGQALLNNGIPKEKVNVHILKEGQGGGHAQIITDAMGLTVAADCSSPFISTLQGLLS
eukprot:CAMPEP_0204893984 /NCGR_PEP_ID=MMETSP1349-20130617/32770_1 /ASSEMBLY_ACC=CAM_ASM_000710 /TAXON_ID=215587 /ORGANISM="Aplanochytrium stocchinoi, Strain GSBS06" /LENGTH=112 /DNA_ID=CAMNT_0052060967 /DNA_START=96 /DNA_END=434 /DNA_ORIENTATION=-